MTVALELPPERAAAVACFYMELRTAILRDPRGDQTGTTILIESDKVAFMENTGFPHFPLGTRVDFSLILLCMPSFIKYGG